MTGGRDGGPAARAAVPALIATLLGIAAALAGAPRASAAEPPLQALAREHVGAGQGVYAVAAGGEVLVAEAADRPVHPASVSKVATSLALLEKLGKDHRFTTRVRAGGPLRDGVLDGDLLLESEGDPFFVDESAFLLLDRLHAAGVREVTGGLDVAGPLLFDWQPDPEGRRVERALAGEAGAEAWASIAPAAGAPSLRAAAIEFRGEPAPGGGEAAGAGAGTGGSARSLATYRSPPLLHIVKVLNGYSNNVFHLVADAIGGPAAVDAVARARVPAEMRDEITIDNGAGAGTTNRLSPRAAVAILAALDAELARSGLSLPDALPVSGVDPGTLAERFPEQRGLVVGKTGTFGSVGASALVGAVRTRRHGVVRFAVLNHWVPVDEARVRQDAFVRALVSAAGGADSWPHREPVRPDYLAARLEP